MRAGLNRLLTLMGLVLSGFAVVRLDFLSSPALLKIAAWLLLLGLVIVTVGPIEWQPISPLPVQIERATALMVIGFVFALAYPRHLLLVAFLLIGATAVLEFAQVLEPSRHGRWLDLAVKVFGASVGLTIGYGFERLRKRRA